MYNAGQYLGAVSPERIQMDRLTTLPPIMRRRVQEEAVPPQTPEGFQLSPVNFCLIPSHINMPDWVIQYAKQAIQTCDPTYINNAASYILQYGGDSGPHFFQLLNQIACLCMMPFPEPMPPQRY